MRRHCQQDKVDCRHQDSDKAHLAATFLLQSRRYGRRVERPQLVGLSWPIMAAAVSVTPLLLPHVTKASTNCVSRPLLHRSQFPAPRFKLCDFRCRPISAVQERPKHYGGMLPRDAVGTSDCNPRDCLRSPHTSAKTSRLAKAE